MNEKATQAENQRLIERLVHAAPFSALSAAQRAKLVEQISVQSFDRDEVLFQLQKDEAPSLWLILEGEVALLDEQGEVLETRGAGDVFGHRIVFDPGQDQQAAYRAQAKTSGQTAHCHADLLAALAEQSSVVAGFLSARLGDRLRALHVGHSDRLLDLLSRAPVTGHPEDRIQQVAQWMSEHNISALPLLTEGRLVGIVTDRDLRTKVLAQGLDPSQPVSKIMTQTPISVSPETLVDDAMLLMMQRGIHHLPVIDHNEQLIGLVSAGDLLRTQAPHPLRLARDIQRADSLEKLVSLSKQGPSVLTGLVHHGSEVTEVGRIASLLTDTITQKLLSLAEQSLGTAPMAWCWVAFGSQARMEQGLISDQDNGLILANAPTDEEADYFKRFANFVCDGLNACGYVYCNGGVMAMGQWRLSLAQWQKTFHHWMNQPDPQSVMNCSIFFDQRAVAGEAELLHTLQTDVLERAAEASIFLRFLAAEAMRHQPAIGLFNRFIQESDDHESKGINLKKGGVLPIVDLARVRALEGAIRAVHTETRLQEAAQAGIMNEHDADDLMHALRFIGNVRLKHQVQCYETGRPITHLVSPDELSGLHQRYLRSAFGIVKRAQLALASRYQL